MERDISDLRTTNKRLGQSLSWIVDVLLQDDGDSKNPEVLKHLKNRKREALESLSYIRDVLMRNATDVDEDRLVGEEEIKDRESKMTSPSIDVPIRRQNDHFAGAPRPPVPAPHLGVGTRKPYTLAGDPSTSDLPGSTSNLHSARLAPRNYTRSNFSDHGQLGVNLPAPAITRLPVSTSIKSRRPPGSASSSSPPSADDRSSRYQVKHDPLGVLP
jgi:TBC1 domain family protein 5